MAFYMRISCWKCLSLFFRQLFTSVDDIVVGSLLLFCLCIFLLDINASGSEVCSIWHILDFSIILGCGLTPLPTLIERLFKGTYLCTSSLCEFSVPPQLTKFVTWLTVDGLSNILCTVKIPLDSFSHPPAPPSDKGCVKWSSTKGNCFCQYRFWCM